MNFTHYDLGHIEGGSVVEIRLRGSAANVRLMDSHNLRNYRQGGQHRFVGGLARHSPVKLQVPAPGNWHVAVDMQGLSGTVTSSVRILPLPGLQPLPVINAAPLRSLPSLVRQRDDALAMAPSTPPDITFDVFISHASEDKDDVARPLADALRQKGLTVWYDEFELRIGDSLRRKIDRGLANSRFGVVILSQAFFGKGWTDYEMDGLVTRSVTGEQILLPIWHRVTRHEVVAYSPSLADRLARSTQTHSVEVIAGEIADVIAGHGAPLHQNAKQICPQG